MSETVQSILDNALKLPIEDRMTIAGSLLESLPQPPDWADTPDEEFHAELVRRAKESESQPGISWAEVESTLRQDIDAHANCAVTRG